MKPSLLFFILFTLVTSVLSAQSDVTKPDSAPVDTARHTVQTVSGNSITTNNVTENSEPDDFPFPALFILGLMAVILLGIGAGIVIATVGLFILFGFVLTGILSTSVIVGIYKKSIDKGFKTFFILSSSVGGCVIGIAGFWLVNKLLLSWAIQPVLLIGAASGLIIGTGLGFIVYFIIKRLSGYFLTKLKMS